MIHAYHEGDKPNFNHKKIKYINIEEVNPELVKFKQRHKDDPVANGEITEIPGGNTHSTSSSVPAASRAPAEGHGSQMRVGCSPTAGQGHGRCNHDS